MIRLTKLQMVYARIEYRIITIDLFYDRYK